MDYIAILLTIASLKDNGIQTGHSTSVSFQLITGSLQLNMSFSVFNGGY